MGARRASAQAIAEPSGRLRGCASRAGSRPAPASTPPISPASAEVVRCRLCHAAILGTRGRGNPGPRRSTLLAERGAAVRGEGARGCALSTSAMQCIWRRARGCRAVCLEHGAPVVGRQSPGRTWAGGVAGAALGVSLCFSASVYGSAFAAPPLSWQAPLLGGARAHDGLDKLHARRDAGQV